MPDRDRGQAPLGHDALFVPALFGGFGEAVADGRHQAGGAVVDVACSTRALTSRSHPDDWPGGRDRCQSGHARGGASSWR